MTYQGRVTKAGTVLLDDPGALPEGTKVAVRPIGTSAKNNGARTKGRRGILKYAGKAKGLPPDSSHNIDHYLLTHGRRFA